MNDVAIIGVGLHPFGRFEGKSAMEMGVDAIFAAVAATMRVWLDWTPPMETSVSAPEAIASGTIYSSFRSLLPPKARPELQSSRFA